MCWSCRGTFTIWRERTWRGLPAYVNRRVWRSSIPRTRCHNGRPSGEHTARSARGYHEGYGTRVRRRWDYVLNRWKNRVTRWPHSITGTPGCISASHTACFFCPKRKPVACPFPGRLRYSLRLLLHNDARRHSGMPACSIPRAPLWSLHPNLKRQPAGLPGESF